MPGPPSEYSEQEIDIPTGTVFAAASLSVGDDSAPRAAAESAVGVITAAPVAIAAAAFCARAPIRLADPAEDGEVRARIGSLFLPRGGSGIRAALAAQALDAVYGLLWTPAINGCGVTSAAGRSIPASCLRAGQYAPPTRSRRCRRRRRWWRE
ncbi:MAG TPA: hypothetical protein VEI03_09680 [Stellaceae bacterium]|nr:hypothetical protein [Stellaceae bacterium]